MQTRKCTLLIETVIGNENSERIVDQAGTQNSVNIDENLYGVDELLSIMNAGDESQSINEAASTCVSIQTNTSSQSHYGLTSCNIEKYIEKRVKNNPEQWIPPAVNKKGIYKLYIYTIIFVSHII